MQRIKLITAFFITVLLASCEKEEELWILPPAGDAKTASVEMGENYDNAFYFSLATGAKVKRNYDEWDLAFATESNEFYVMMNGGKNIQLYNTHETDFDKTSYTALANSPWVWDNPNGKKDSMAFGSWMDSTGLSKNEVYILDLGAAAVSRYIKFQFISANANEYRFRYAEINNAGKTETSIAKDNSRNFSYYSFLLNAKVDFEPVNTSWDLLFTKYRHIYYDLDPITPYAVTGVLINTRFVTIFESETLKFDDIDYEKATTLMLTSKADEIGYDWKFYDLNGTGKYTVVEKKIYIIKDHSGVYYKLKFIGFYNDQGIKGTPKFVYQRL